MAKLGPWANFTAYMCIHIYTHRVFPSNWDLNFSNISVVALKLNTVSVFSLEPGSNFSKRLVLGFHFPGIFDQRVLWEHFGGWGWSQNFPLDWNFCVLTNRPAPAFGPELGFWLLYCTWLRSTCERLQEFITWILANLVFSGVYLVFKVFQDAWRSNKENPNWNATLSCPFIHGFKLCRFVSGSDLVLILLYFIMYNLRQPFMYRIAPSSLQQLCGLKFRDLEKMSVLHC